MPEVATPNQAEREFETGTDESFKSSNSTATHTHNENQQLIFSNIKRTYDVYQDLDIQTARQGLIETTRINQIAAQAVQNAVETANMVAKQALRHGDIAIDAQWNPVQQGTGDNITGRTVMDSAVAAKAVDAAIAKSVDASIAPVAAILATMAESLKALTIKLSGPSTP